MIMAKMVPSTKAALGVFFSHVLYGSFTRKVLIDVPVASPVLVVRLASTTSVYVPVMDSFSCISYVILSKPVAIC